MPCAGVHMRLCHLQIVNDLLPIVNSFIHGVKWAGMIINERVRAARVHKKLGTQELARRAQLSAAAISRLERQARMPRVDTLQKIAAALEVSVSFLVGERRADLEMHVALAQESLEIYLRDGATTPDEIAALVRISSERSAPIWVEDWTNLRSNIAITKSMVR